MGGRGGPRKRGRRGLFTKCLYRTIPGAAISNKGPGTLLSDVTTSDGGKRWTVNHFKDAVLPTNRVADEQPLERLVGVHQRHTERIGEMLLCEWKLDASIFDQAGLFRPHKQMQEQIGSTLKRGATPKSSLSLP